MKKKPKRPVGVPKLVQKRPPEPPDAEARAAQLKQLGENWLNSDQAR